MSVTIYHNARCSSSRRTLELLRDRGEEPDIIEYLKTPPDAKTLKSILGMLGLSVRDVLRRNEAVYAELGLGDPGKSDDELIAAIVANPILLQRPIVIKDGKAAIGRPPESVIDIL